MRPIDADMLMQQVIAIHNAVDTSDINRDYDVGYHSATSTIRGLIAEMPTVQKRGHWIHHDLTEGVCTFSECSVCGTHIHMCRNHCVEEDENYCPHCGAKMDKDGEKNGI